MVNVEIKEAMKQRRQRKTSDKDEDWEKEESPARTDASRDLLGEESKEEPGDQAEDVEALACQECEKKEDSNEIPVKQ